MVLFLHHRYRISGGEERAVDDLMWLVREHLGEDAELLTRTSDTLGRATAAAGLLRGGLDPAEVASAVRRTGARIVHAHNLHPTLGWRALAAARAAGAAVVLHLHQYRLVCAIGVCFRDGHECTRCHGRNTLPGVVHNCRGSGAEAVAYGAGLALWQRRLTAQADAFVVPSHFAESRLRELGAPLTITFRVPHVTRQIAAAPPHRPGGPALVAARLAPEKGVDTALEAGRLAEREIVVAGDGPERARLQARSADARFLGEVSPDELEGLRAAASVALVPSRSAETFGLAAAEAMAAGLPVLASRIGALPELVPDDWLVAPGDACALAQAMQRVAADPDAPAQALARARATTAPEVVAPALAEVYAYARSALNTG
ncbi:MAG: glycosyltransferase [Solirubrobacteraceae bacterium]